MNKLSKKTVSKKIIIANERARDINIERKEEERAWLNIERKVEREMSQKERSIKGKEQKKINIQLHLFDLQCLNQTDRQCKLQIQVNFMHRNVKYVKNL